MSDHLRVLDPRAFPEQVSSDAPPLASLQGATIVFLWNNRPRGDVILRGVAAAFEKRYGATVLFEQKLRVGTGAPLELIARVSKEAQAAVVGVGD